MDINKVDMGINNKHTMVTVGISSRVDTAAVDTVDKWDIKHRRLPMDKHLKRHHTNNNRQYHNSSNRCMVEHRSSNNSLELANGNQRRHRMVKFIITMKGQEKLNGTNQLECLRKRERGLTL